MAQGYLISRPLLADQVLPWLARWATASGPATGEAA